MTSDRLRQLHALGQGIWLDYIDRAMLRSGDLARRIREDSLTGMTSNPTIFQKALAEGREYDAQIAQAPPELEAPALFELLATDDVRAACDRFAFVYTSSRGADGYVSIEVAPHLADDERGTVAEATRLWRVVDRPNVMIKVPGTIAGARAVRRLIADGINVNITLLFALDAHARVIEAYLAGLEDRIAAGRPIDHIASVASFFVSRVDTETDARIAARVASVAPEATAPLNALRGRMAIANAKLAYRLFHARFSGARWDALHARGARLQRPLWASTSSKNPAYRDVIYVEQLIGPDTVNTMPPATIDAFRDHGIAARTVDTGLDDAERAVAALHANGISLIEITDKLLADGLAAFQRSYTDLLAGLERKCVELGRELVRSG
jgi:transaldolase